MDVEPYWSDKDVLASGKRAIATHIPDKNLIAYLEKYQQDLLTTGTVQGLPSFAAQRAIIVAAMRKKYAEVHGYHQTIAVSSDEVPKFWELIFSLDFVSHEIKLANNVGYRSRVLAPGIRSTRKVPYAEFVIIGDNLKKAVALKSEPAPPVVEDGVIPAPLAADEGIQTVTVNLTVEGIFYAEIGNEKYVIKKVRRDGAIYNFINYVLVHQQRDISRTTIETEVQGCSGKKNMTELAKLCGFTNELFPLKAIFFGGTTKTKVLFKASANLNRDEVELLMKREKLIA
jgi:hypothetical protein